MYKLPEGKYAGYLRKSRVDIEAETKGGEDTYKAHERILLELATRLGVTLERIYKEKPATSGERISERPEMISLLEDIENEEWTGVFAVEVERLARGDTMDQGIVAQAFKYSETLIVTPARIYNPNDSNDEEYFEFGLFMSRREFKTITRRLQSGRVGSVKEGRYIGSKPPYGYSRVKLPGKGYTLEPHPEQAPVVQLIFAIYTDPDPTKRMGTALLAKYLNDVKKIPTAENKKWIVGTINRLLRNQTYIGKVIWGVRPLIKKKNSKSRPRREGMVVPGLHPALIDEVTFMRAQQIMKENGHAPAPRGKISNPLAGIIRCDMCGGPIVMRPYAGQRAVGLICPSQDCRNVSSDFRLVEERLLQGLGNWLAQLKNELEDRRQPRSDDKDDLKLKALERTHKGLLKQMNELTEQKNGLHDLVEKKVYTIEVYMERSALLNDRYTKMKKLLEESEEELQRERRKNQTKYEKIPMVERVLSEYVKADSIEEKNDLLKTIIQSIKYRKEKGGRWDIGAIDRFDLIIEPKI